MRYTFDDDGADAPASGQYYCMLGTRGMWEDGWKAVAVHGPTSGIGNFDQDGGSSTTSTRTAPRRRDLAAEHPEKRRRR